MVLDSLFWMPCVAQDNNKMVATKYFINVIQLMMYIMCRNSRPHAASVMSAVMAVMKSLVL